METLGFVLVLSGVCVLTATLIQNWWQRKHIESQAKLEMAMFDLHKQRDEFLTFGENQKGLRGKVVLELARIIELNRREHYSANSNREMANLIRLRGILAEKIIEQFDFQNMDMKQMMVVVEMLKDANRETDLAAADARWEQIKAEAKKTETETDSIRQDVKMKKLKVAKTKDGLKSGFGIKTD